MADDIDFTASLFATYGMMPTRDEELNALWGRKIAWNTARSIGAWGTLVATQTSVTTIGTGVINIAGLGFNTLPSIDVWHMRGGTEPWYMPMYFVNDPPAGGDPFGLKIQLKGGTQIHFEFATDWKIATEQEFLQTEDGTFVYRLRGW